MSGIVPAIPPSWKTRELDVDGAVIGQLVQPRGNSVGV